MITIWWQAAWCYRHLERGTCRYGGKGFGYYWNAEPGDLLPPWGSPRFGVRFLHSAPTVEMTGWGDICVVYGMRFQDLNSVLSNRLLSDKASIISSQSFCYETRDSWGRGREIFSRLFFLLSIDWKCSVCKLIDIWIWKQIFLRFYVLKWLHIDY